MKKFSFKGGIHPHDNKFISENCSIKTILPGDDVLALEYMKMLPLVCLTLFRNPLSLLLASGCGSCQRGLDRIKGFHQFSYFVFIKSVNRLGCVE